MSENRGMDQQNVVDYDRPPVPPDAERLPTQQPDPDLERGERRGQRSLGVEIVDAVSSPKGETQIFDGQQLAELYADHFVTEDEADGSVEKQSPHVSTALLGPRSHSPGPPPPIPGGNTSPTNAALEFVYPLREIPSLTANSLFASPEAGVMLVSEEIDRLQQMEFETRIQYLYGPTVVYSNSSSATVNLAALLRVQLQYLQRDLVRDAFNFKYDTQYSGAAIADKQGLMSTYITALKDYEYVKERALMGQNDDPFIVTSERLHDRMVLEETLKLWMEGGPDMQNFQLLELQSHLDEIHRSRPPIDTEKWYFSEVRGPEQIRKNHSRSSFNGRVTNLVTTSVCVLAFGLLISVFLEKPFDVLSATAAYAAVLVVFVGTSTSTGTSSSSASA
ncbi:uncharacterized protein PAC_03338 [Phialocephala subalpina]|uniref:Uncharacterized protein n=1 Tax=Phialocephala subalpina TaxID=576137 RepID=A0A1L7WL09_9HELO|nr:uncharacterized protein PAC_03338 [Phialocephala subalpina]